LRFRVASGRLWVRQHAAIHMSLIGRGCPARVAAADSPPQVAATASSPGNTGIAETVGVRSAHGPGPLAGVSVSLQTGHMIRRSAGRRRDDPTPDGPGACRVSRRTGKCCRRSPSPTTAIHRWRRGSCEGTSSSAQRGPQDVTSPALHTVRANRRVAAHPCTDAARPDEPHDLTIVRECEAAPIRLRRLASNEDPTDGPRVQVEMQYFPAE
jgi:hypothetical protein